MKNRAQSIAFGFLLAVLAVAYVRSAWRMPLRNYPFDFSINYTGARLLVQSGYGAPLYDRATLAAEAAQYSEYSALYTKLFLTYIQTPLTAVLLMPVATLSLDGARLAVLIVSNAMFGLAAALVVWVLRPTRLLVLAAFIIFASYEAMFDSLRLGNVDGVILLLLAVAFVAVRRGPPWLVGAPLAGAAILKLSPAIIVGYFLWRREWRVLVGAGVAAALVLALSVGVAGWQNHVTFVQEISPRLAQGSTFYDNISLGGAMARAHFGPWSWYWEDQVPTWPLWLRGAWVTLSAVIVLGGYALTRHDREAGFMLATASAVLVAPISWSFYAAWLIPSLLFLVSRYQQRRAWGSLALLALLYPAMSIVPAHLSVVSDQVYRWPLKTGVLALYWLLLAVEGRGQSTSARTPVRPTGHAAMSLPR